MERKRNCVIVQDLLPAYVDRMTKPETTSFVDAHLTDCESCRKVCRAMSGALPPEAVRAEEIVQRLKAAHDRRRAIGWAIAAAVLLILAVCLLPLPRRIDVTHQGVLWRCGAPEEETLVSVQVEGMYYDFLFLEDRFDVKLMSEQAAPMLDMNQIHAPLGNGQYGIWYRSTGEGMISIGGVFLRPTGDGVMMLLYDEEGHWNGSSGQMLTAPASTREEAVALANQLADELSPTWLGPWNFE